MEGSKQITREGRLLEVLPNFSKALVFNIAFSNSLCHYAGKILTFRLVFQVPFCTLLNSKAQWPHSQMFSLKLPCTWTCLRNHQWFPSQSSPCSPKAKKCKDSADSVPCFIRLMLLVSTGLKSTVSVQTETVREACFNILLESDETRCPYLHKLNEYNLQSYYFPSSIQNNNLSLY